MKVSVDLGFGLLEFYDTYVIGTMYEGRHLEAEEDTAIFECCAQYYSGKPFGYISNRKNSYSFNPMAHRAMSNELSNLIAYAVVAYSPAQRLSYSVEKIFLSKPLEYFDAFEDAVIWVTSLVSSLTPAMPSIQK